MVVDKEGGDVTEGEEEKTSESENEEMDEVDDDFIK